MAGPIDSESESSITIYLREIGKVPLLTVQDEIDLAAIIKKGVEAEVKIKEFTKKVKGIPAKVTVTKTKAVKKTIPDKDKAKKAALQKLAEEGAQARERMIKSNLRLVVKIAHDYSNFGLPLIDLISEGNIGLMKAVERFDPNKGGKLSTYSSWWIKQSIKRALANQSKTIRLPVHLVDKISKMRRVAARMSEEFGREPTDEELADEMSMSVTKIARLRTAAIRPASLDAPISNDEDSANFGDIIKDESALNPYEMLRSKKLKDDLDELLAILDAREREIINFRFGLDGANERTLEEVGVKFKITRERVRQIQNIALNKMLKAMGKKDRQFISID
ncbi:MAG: sigma-70 family RNA polymerase sigma factor [Verrucomicrobiota bacterium]|nr:sigma-70 family RNA polymerase sigma factor [Verrucomicrobiota bacterium]